MFRKFRGSFSLKTKNHSTAVSVRAGSVEGLVSETETAEVIPIGGASTVKFEIAWIADNSASASSITCVVWRTVSGLSEIEDMPRSTRKRANSG